MNTRYRADLPAWILFGGLSCLGLFIAYIDMSQSGQVTALSIFLIVASLFSLAWLLSFQIELTPDEVSFRSLFRGRKRIRNEQIKKVSLTFDFWRRREGPWQLIIEPRDRSTKELRINAKFFSRAGIDAVLARGGEVAEADDSGLREGVALPTFRELKRGGLSTVRILVGAVVLLLGAVALVGASIHSFETLIFFSNDRRRLLVELCILGSAILLLFIGNRLLGEHHWVKSMARQAPLFVASFGFLGVMIYVWRIYFAREPHAVTTSETIWFFLSLAGFALCTHRFRPRRKRKRRTA